MSDWGKIINEFEIEYAPVNYENISNFNLDEELMHQYGFRPVRTEEYTEEVSEKFKYPKLKYTLVEDEYIYGYWDNVPPTVEELRTKMLSDLEKCYQRIFDEYVLYVDEYVVKFNEYTKEELNAFVVSQEEQYIHTSDDKYVLFNQKQLLKLLQDKLKLEGKVIVKYQQDKEDIKNATTLEELENITFEYPIIYYHFQDLGNKHIGNEELLDNSTKKYENALNISIYHSDETRVYYGKLGINGLDYLNEHHIPAIELSYNAGTIVGLEGDLNLTCTSMNPNIDKIIIEALRKALENLGFNATTDSNDILIDGKKAIGASNFIQFNKNVELFYSMYIHISFNIDNELIDIVRVKPKVKECTGLKIEKPEITQEQVLSEFYNELKNAGFRRFECQE